MFSRDEFSNWLSRARWSALKHIHMSNPKWTQQVVLMYLYLCIHIARTIKDRIGKV